METNGVRFHAVPLVVLLFLFFSGNASGFNRNSFPAHFAFGAASSAYQYEGAAFEDGKGPSIWDTYTHKFPEKILDGSNGDVALDFYHRYKEDVKLMKFIGLDAFRMSISWPRILPKGKLSGGVNKNRISFYNNVLNELIHNGITPFVTLFHWDLPQALEDEYKGFLSPLIVDYFKDFVEICFKEFGDRVKHWITFNEPYVFVNGGYDGGVVGTLAPGRCSNRANCPEGDAAIEPYMVGHHQLICHAEAVKIYRDKFKAAQKGDIGITLLSHWMAPFSNNSLDVKAAQRALDFMLGWFADPLIFGEYPKIMRSLVGNRLPKFTEEQSSMIKGSFDFLGINYYTGSYVAHLASSNGINITSSADNMVRTGSIDSKGVSIGAPTGVGVFFVYPKGLYNLLVYIKNKYNSPTIYITENGYGSTNNTVKDGIEDPRRVGFHKVHLLAVREAIRDGVNVKGYFGWSFLDNFEWGSGYTIRFGFYYIDYKNGLRRIAKSSALWFKKFLLKN